VSVAGKACCVDRFPNVFTPDHVLPPVNFPKFPVTQAVVPTMVLFSVLPGFAVLNTLAFN
jgi:hypothetical protein